MEQIKEELDVESYQEIKESKAPKLVKWIINR